MITTTTPTPFAPIDVVGSAEDAKEVVERVFEAIDAGLLIDEGGAETRAVMTAELTDVVAREDCGTVLAAGIGMAMLASVADGPDRVAGASLEADACEPMLVV